MIKIFENAKTKINEIKTLLGEDFIFHLTSKYNDLGQNFIHFLGIYEDLNKKTQKQISKICNIKRSALVSWLKGQYPWSIKCLLEIHKNSFHKIPKPILARIIGWGFGDGGLDERPHYFFICGDLDKLKLIQDFFIKYTKLKGEIQENKAHVSITKIDGTKEEIVGESWILRIQNTSFAMLLYGLGLPKGSKTIQPFLIPQWVIKGTNDVKKEFFSGLFESELEKFRIEKKETKIIIYPPIFGMNKSGELIKNLEDFFNQIKFMLKEFKIDSSKIEKPIPSRIRKDGRRTFFIRFKISGYAENVINFSKFIDFKFDEEKKKCLEKAIFEAELKIKRKQMQLGKYKQAIEFYQKGHKMKQISRELDLSYSTIRSWVKLKDHLPIPMGEINE